MWLSVEVMSNPKKYYWLKLFDNFFSDPKIKKLRRLAGGDTYIVILLKMMLYTVKTNGVYEYQGLESTLSKELVWVLDENEDHIQAVLVFLEKTKLIEEIEDNHFLLTQVPLMLGSEGDSAEQKRAQREREKEKSVTLSHDSHALVTQSHTEKEIEKEIEKDSLTKEREIFKNLQSFKKYFIEHKKEPFNTVGIGFASTTYFKIQHGLLVNTVNSQILSNEEAFKVWKYLYDYNLNAYNQQRAK